MSFIEANGVRFAYVEEGRGPLVLMLHGFPDTPRTWDFVRPRLASAGFRVVTPFLRGYAPTSIPADGAYDADTLGRDVLALVDSLGENRAIVVGHDWGASAAYAAAALDDTRVSKLVTVALPHPASIVPTPKLLWSIRHFAALRTRSAAANVRANDFAMLHALVRRWSPTWDVPAHETDAVKEVFRHDGALDAALGYYRAMGLVLPSSHKKKIAVPTTTFAGTDDPTFGPRAYERSAKWFTKGHRVVTLPGGHFLHREHPELFTRALLDVVTAA